MRVPEHIAIIMDGNGRWAKKRNLPRAMGHRAGVKTIHIVAEACAKLGIKALTLYAFSTENWKRAEREVKALMGLFEENLKKNLKKFMENNIRFNMIGRLEELPTSLKDGLENTMKATSANSGMIFTLAINYGGRQEILDAVKKICGGSGADVSSWNEDDLAGYLYTSGLPDPELVIRTSGEMRLSNFLLWQAAYAEFYATDTLWPDFTEEDLKKAIDEYGKRERRFGE